MLVLRLNRGEQEQSTSTGGAGGGRGGSSSSSTGERCPICNSHFADVALLVSHVEAMHPDGAGSASKCSVS